MSKKMVTVLITLALAAGMASATVVFESGDVQYAAYGGGLIVTTNYTDTTFIDPVTKIESPAAAYDVANQNFDALDLSGGTALDVDIYGDGSGGVWRISIWSGPLGNPFLYKDIAVSWTGWQSLTLNFDGSNDGFAFWANGTPYTAADTITQATVLSFQSWGTQGTIFVDNARVEGAVPEPATLALLSMGVLAVMKRK